MLVVGLFVSLFLLLAYSLACFLSRFVLISLIATLRLRFYHHGESTNTNTNTNTRARARASQHICNSVFIYQPMPVYASV